MSDSGTVVVTGPRGGMTSIFVATYAAAHPDDHLILLLRDTTQHAPLPPPSKKIEHAAFDMQSLSAVRSAGKSIRTRVDRGEIPRIKAVVCSAAIQVTGADQPRVAREGLKESGEGMEETVAVNHLAHFALILALLPAVATGGRVVIVGSKSHQDDYAFFKRRAAYGPLEELLWVKPGSEPAGEAYDRGMQRYGTSKLLQVMTGHELARRLRNSPNPTYASLHVAMADPGSMGGTSLFRDQSYFARTILGAALRWPSILNWLVPGVDASLKEDSAQTLYKVVSDPEYYARTPMDSSNGGAPYYSPWGELVDTQGKANGPEAAELWADSVKVLGLGREEGLL